MLLIWSQQQINNTTKLDKDFIENCKTIVGKKLVKIHNKTAYTPIVKLLIKHHPLQINKYLYRYDFVLVSVILLIIKNIYELI